MDWTFEVRTRLGELVYAVPEGGCDIGDVEFVDGGAGGASITVLDAEAKRLLTSLDGSVWNELWVWADGRLLMPVLPQKPSRRPSSCTIQGSGPLAYLDWREVGGADRTNYLTNPSFDAGLTGWTPVGVTATADTAITVEDGNSARLVLSPPSATDNVDAYLEQTFSIVPSSDGESLYAAGWVYIEDAGWVGPAFAQRGLWLGRPAAGRWNHAPISGDFPRGSWQWMEVEHWIPPGTDPVDVTLRLYCPNAVTRWDEMVVVSPQSLSNLAADVSTIVTSLVNHAQDPAIGYESLGLGVEAPPTGITRTWVWQYSDHPNVGRALREVAADAGVTVEVVWDADGANRRVRVVSPARGVAAVPVATVEHATDEYGNLAGEIVDWNLGIDVGQAVTDLIALGPGRGPARPEGADRDPGGFGGLTIRRTVVAPDGIRIRDLDRWAASARAPLAAPLTGEVVVRASERVDVARRVVEGSLRPGDLVWVRIPDEELDEALQVVSIRMLPAAELVELSVNRPPAVPVGEPGTPVHWIRATSGTPTGGSWRLTFGAVGGTAIPWDADPADVVASLVGVPGVTVVGCTGGPLPAYGITLTMTSADPPSIDDSLLVGGLMAIDQVG